MFEIVYNTLITWMSPIARRMPTYFAWLQTLCSGVVSMYNEFTAASAQYLYQLNHDSRVFSMQAVLNDGFDNDLRRIYITDGFNKERIYAYTREEAQPVFLNPEIPLFNREDYNDTGVDFIVWVPAALGILTNPSLLVQFQAQVNLYRLASKRYTIYNIIA